MNELKQAEKLELKARQLRDKRKTVDRYNKVFTEIDSFNDILIFDCHGKQIERVSFETFERAYRHAKKYQPKKAKLP